MQASIVLTCHLAYSQTYKPGKPLWAADAQQYFEAASLVFSYDTDLQR